MNSWKVLHIELSKGIPILTIEPGYQGLYVMFWWHEIPLGHQEIPAAQLPMPATQLTNLVLHAIAPAVAGRLLAPEFKVASPIISQNLVWQQPPALHAWLKLSQPLKQLQECCLPVAEPMSISVAICTRDRPEQLARCLRSLQNLSSPPLEILVIDNAPTSDATYQLVAQMPEIRYLREPRPGLSAARNTAISHSQGDIIAFTDDDVIVHPDWIAQLQQSFCDPQVMAVTGLVVPAKIETEAQFIFEKYWGFNRGYRPLTFEQEFFEKMKQWGVPVWQIGAGANMAVRRKAFELVGNFDERLGAGTSGCSEDSELWYRILATGWLCRYEPTVVVYHYHRQDLESLQRQIYYYMRGHVAALLIQFENYGHWGNLRRLFLIMPKYYAKSSLRRLLKGFQPQDRTLLVEILGCLSGVKFYLQNMRFSKLLQSHSIKET